jgi:hypothetical protein
MDSPAKPEYDGFASRPAYVYAAKPSHIETVFTLRQTAKSVNRPLPPTGQSTLPRHSANGQAHQVQSTGRGKCLRGKDLACLQRGEAGSRRRQRGVSELSSHFSLALNPSLSYSSKSRKAVSPFPFRESRLIYKIWPNLSSGNRRSSGAPPFPRLRSLRQLRWRAVFPFFLIPFLFSIFHYPRPPVSLVP